MSRDPEYLTLAVQSSDFHLVYSPSFFLGDWQLAPIGDDSWRGDPLPDELVQWETSAYVSSGTQTNEESPSAANRGPICGCRQLMAANGSHGDRPPPERIASCPPVDGWRQLVGRYGTLNSRAIDERAANAEQHDGESHYRAAASHNTTKEAAVADFDATPRDPTTMGTEVAESCKSPIRGTDARPAASDQSPRTARPQPLNFRSHKANEQAIGMDECQESSAKPEALDLVVDTDLVPEGLVAEDPPARPGTSATCPIDLTLNND